MRNYVQMFFGRTDFEDGAANKFHETSIEQSWEDIDLELQLEAAQLASAGFVNINGYRLGTRYFLLDKVNIVNILAAATADYWWNNPYAQQWQGPESTPRIKGWTDSDGIKRKPPPSEDKQIQIVGKTGKSGQIVLATDPLQYLQTVLGLLQQQLVSVTGEVGADIALAAALIADLIKQLTEKKISGKNALAKAKIIMDNLFQQIGGS